MRIVCLGGGPAGLSFAALAKLRHPGLDVTVLERNPPGVTYGWGVVFSGQLLGELHRHDPVLGRSLRRAATTWEDQVVRRGDASPAHLGGYGYSIARRRLLEVLTDRAADLGVRLVHGRTVDGWDGVPDVDAVRELPDLADADLVVACDGVNSAARRRFADGFGTTVRSGSNRYLWLGTPRRFDAFTFGFERTHAGWIWFHAYRFDARTSTFIVECGPQTWSGLGLDDRSPEDAAGLLQDVFARHLDGEPLLHQADERGRMPWLTFTDVTNGSWVQGRLALMGDAAHTTHFSIGSGTTLAVQDAIALARRLGDPADLGAALTGYDTERRAAMALAQEAARSSARWYEEVDRHADLDPVEFGYSMLNRRWGGAPPGAGAEQRRRVYLATQHPALRLARRAVRQARRVAHTGLDAGLARRTVTSGRSSA